MTLLALAVSVSVAAAVLLWPARPGPRVAEPAADGPSAPGPADGPDVADLLDLLALALRGGAGVSESLLVVGSTAGGAQAADLRVVGAALQWGLPGQAAWASVGPQWAPAATALRLAALAGVPPADQLARAAGELRRQHRARLEEEAGRVGVRLVLPLGLTFLPAFLLATVLPVVLALAGSVLGG